MQRQDAVVRESECRHSEPTTRRELEHPSSQELVQLLVDVWVLDQVTGGIDLQNSLDDSGFAAGEPGVRIVVGFDLLLSLRRSEKLQKPLIVALLGCGLQLLDL